MPENALQLLVAGQQQDGTLSPQPALQPAQRLSWFRGVPLPGELCAHPCSSTPWDQARREASLPFMRKRSRWEIIQKKMWGGCVQNQSHAWNQKYPQGTGSGLPSLPHLPPTLFNDTPGVFIQTVRAALSLLSVWCRYGALMCNARAGCTGTFPLPPHMCSSPLLLGAALQPPPSAARHAPAAFTRGCAAPPPSMPSLLLPAPSLPLAKPAVSRGCSRCLPACRSSRSPRRVPPSFPARQAAR